MLLNCVSNANAQEFSNGSIDFIFQPDYHLLQLAVWIEKQDGEYISTVFLTNFIGRYGGGNRTADPDIDATSGNRLSALPVWSHKRGIIDTTFGMVNYYPPAENQPAYPDDVDAISGATLDQSLQTKTFQLSDLPYGIYNCWIELNMSFDQNEYHDYSSYRGQPSLVWNVPINVSDEPDSSMILEYSGYGSPDGSTGMINAPDNTITTASDLLYDLGGYKFKAIYSPGEISIDSNIISLQNAVAYYPFNGNAYDYSGNNHHGVVNGAVLTEDRFGHPNNAYFFDGINDYIDLGNLGDYDSHTFTGWFFINHKSSGYAQIISKINEPSYPLMNSEFRINGLNTRDNYNIDYQFGTGSVWTGITASNYEVDSVNWHHFAFIYDDDAKNIKVYLDGEISDSSSVSGYADATNIPTYIGARPSWNGNISFYYHGSIDDIRIYDKPLNKEEVTMLYNEGLCLETVYDTVAIEVLDTTNVTIYDTIPVFDSIAVTDTLLIDANLTGVDPSDKINTIKVYPNPTNDHIFIDAGDYAKMIGYRLRIINQSGAVVFETSIEDSLYEVNLSTWSGLGLYYIQVIDSGGSIIIIRKIILQ